MKINGKSITCKAPDNRQNSGQLTSSIIHKTVHAAFNKDPGELYAHAYMFEDALLLNAAHMHIK